MVCDFSISQIAHEIKAILGFHDQRLSILPYRMELAEEAEGKGSFVRALQNRVKSGEFPGVSCRSDAYHA